MFEQIINEFSTLDILVNNAGIGNFASAVDMKDDVWNKMLGVHLYGTMNCTREALKIMLKNKSGKIINIASICGITGCLGAAALFSCKRRNNGVHTCRGKRSYLARHKRQCNSSRIHRHTHVIGRWNDR